jgi:pimeloyl-ACP methyl ester carboxylesterase
MNDYFITLNGQSVHYLESSGRGRPVLFVHGNSSSARAFAAQLDSDFGATFRCIAVDLPGHGKSAPGADPATDYTIPGYGRFLLAFLDALRLKDILAVGWSLGGLVLLEVADLLPARGVVISGAPPFGHPPAFDRAYFNNPAGALLVTPELSESEIELLTDAITADRGLIRSDVVQGLKVTDPQARGCLGASAGRLDFRDEIEIVRHLSKPLMVLHGELDPIVNPTYFASLEMPTLYHETVHIVPRAGHHIFAEKPEDVNRLLEEFIRDIPTRQSIPD